MAELLFRAVTLGRPAKAESDVRPRVTKLKPCLQARLHKPGLQGMWPFLKYFQVWRLHTRSMLASSKGQQIPYMIKMQSRSLD